MRKFNSTTASKFQFQVAIDDAFRFRTQLSFRRDHCSAKNARKLVLTFSSKLNTSSGGTGLKVVKKKKNEASQLPPIAAPEPGRAPSVSGGEEPPPIQSTKTGFSMLKRIPKRLFAVLANLPLAIAEMFAVAALMALGTVSYVFQQFNLD